MSGALWIKVTTGIWSSDSIKLIRKMPDGDTLLVIWFQLITQAGKCNAGGRLQLSEYIPLDTDMLATIFDRPLETVERALSVFKRFGMVDLDDDCTILPNWYKYQSEKGLDEMRLANSERQQRWRDKQKQKKEHGILCVYCGDGAGTTDHIIAKSHGGNDLSDNKVEACDKCNQSKGNKDVATFLNQRIMMGNYVAVDSILSNEKLMSVMDYNGNSFSIKSNVMSRYKLTLGNKAEIDKEKDSDKDNKNNLSGGPDVSDKIPYAEIVDYFNAACGTNFRPTGAETKKYIRARWTDGFRLDDFKRVIDNKNATWNKPPTKFEPKDMRPYLRPKTMFGTSFESYLNEKPPRGGGPTGGGNGGGRTGIDRGTNNSQFVEE